MPQSHMDIRKMSSGIELEVDVWSPDVEVVNGFAVVAHPHPLQGGSKDHKVVHSIAKALNQLGYCCHCPNFRGVGLSSGQHDGGKGEIDDLVELWQSIHTQFPSLPTIFSGFSFGGYVAAHVQHRVRSQEDVHHNRLLLVGPAVGKYEIQTPEEIPDDTLVIHGDQDEIISLSQVFEWAEPRQLAVMVVPGAGHFFHGRQLVLQRLITHFFV